MSNRLCSVLLTLVGALVFASLSFVASAVTSAATRGPNVCHMGLGDRYATDICFVPARASVAEGRMRVQPVRPGQTIWKLTGLRLNQVELRVTDHPFGIQYLYGRMPLWHGIAVTNGARPKYVLISEAEARDPQPMPRPFEDPSGLYWSLHTNFRCRPLSLHLWTNVSSRAAAAALHDLMRRDTCSSK